jgi:8-oxo-dGTP pyrophosphatase MutT (NUDIX family)
MENKTTRVFVCAVIRNNEGKFLLLKRANDSHFAPGEWEFLSGTIDSNETAEECIKREVNEETGLIVNVLEAKPVFEITDKDGRWVVIPYEAKVDLSDVKISDEHSEFAWMHRNEIEIIPYMQDMKSLWA